jgi:hypothetical protein
MQEVRQGHDLAKCFGLVAVPCWHMLACFSLSVDEVLKVYYLFPAAQRSSACSDFHARFPWCAGGRPAEVGLGAASLSFVAVRRGARDTLGDVGNRIVGNSARRRIENRRSLL